MSLPDYATKALSLHNSFRAQHNSPPLEWSTELHIAAKKYATELVTRKVGEKLGPKSDLNIKLGQNVYELKSPVKWLSVPQGTAVQKAITEWYNTIRVYNWENPTAGTDKSALNFSQIVWSDSKRMGLGVAVSKNGDTAVVVAFYDPPGNIRGLFQANVKRAGQKQADKNEFDSKRGQTSQYSIPSSTRGASLSTSTSTYRQLTSSEQPTSDDDELLPLPLHVAVELHSQYRTKHGVDKLKLDYKLCERANQYATSLAMGKGPPLGVSCSIYRVEDPNVDPVEAVRKAVTKWYGQLKNYNWLSPMSCKHETELFAQLIWKSSKQFGIGLACHQNAVAVVALYSPSANMNSEQNYKENVRPSVSF